MKKNNFCQSCGYPMKKDKNGGGSNNDGTISEKYCSMCYENGNFLSPPEIDTAEKFQKFCIQEMKKDGMNGILAWILTRGIPRLDRWKNKKSDKKLTSLFFVWFSNLLIFDNDYYDDFNLFFLEY